MSGIMDRLRGGRRRRSGARPLLCIMLFATPLLLSVGATLASDCPPNNPRDCEAAATTARNPLVPVAGAVAGGLLGLVTRRVIGGIISASPTPPEDWLKDWDPQADDAFCSLGRRIGKMSAFKGPRKEVDKTRFAFERMVEVARRYHLRAGSGGFMDQLAIGYWRGGGGFIGQASTIGGGAGGILGLIGGFIKGKALLGLLGGGLAGGILAGLLGGLALWMRPRGFDPESVLPLKRAGLGNCGEWAIAFREMLRCAGIDRSMIVAADHDPKESDFSGGFGGTDTAVMLYDDLRDKRSYRIFDVFRELFHNQPDSPSPGGPAIDWSGPAAEEWLKKGVRKKYIKDFNGKVIYP